MTRAHPPRHCAWSWLLAAAWTCSLWLAFGGALAAQAGTAPTVHVSPEGDDRWSGGPPQAGDSGQGPVRTIAAAQRRARTLLQHQQRHPRESSADAASHEPYAVRVLIHPGRYELDEPLRFTPADSGLPGRPMRYEAATPGTVTVSGGRLLPRSPPTGDDSDASEVWHFSLPTPGQRPDLQLDDAFWASAPQLYVQGQRAVLARMPDAGRHWYAGTPVAVPGDSPQAPGHQAFHAQPEALAFVRDLSAAEQRRALLHVMQSWTSGRHRLVAGAPPGALRVQPRSRWPFLFFGASQRYHLENVQAAFDAPGEWIGGPDGVRLRPLPGQPAPEHALLPLLQQLVQVRGSGPAGPYVEHLELRGLHFEATHEPTPAGGWVDNQAVLERGAAIEVDFARHFVLQGCQMQHLGAHAVWLREGVRDSRVEACALRDLGAGGVKIGTAKPSGPAAQHTGANQLLHNLITHTGRHWPGAVGVWVGPSFDNTVAHNTIAHTHYTGISLGWSWGDRPPASGRNQVRGNALLHIGSGMLADLGAVYTLGPSEGTVIEDNFIFDVRGYRGHGAGAWGLYTDEGSRALVLRHNVVIGTDGGGYHLHYGSDLLLQHNLLAGGEDAEVSVTRSDPGRTRLQVLGNLLLPVAAQPFAGFARAPDASYRGNAVARWHVDEGALERVDLNACGGGCTASSAQLRPATEAARDRSGSETPAPSPTATPGLQVWGLPDDDDASALALGLPTAAQGRRWAEVVVGAGAGAVLPAARQSPVWDTTAWAQALRGDRRSLQARQPDGPEVDRAPPLRMDMDLQALPMGARPPGWRIQPAPAPGMAQAVAAAVTGTVAVVRDDAAPGGRCLQLTDSPGLRFPFEPYIHHPLNHINGHSRVRFALRVDAAAQVTHEWRDTAKPYRSGPSLRISAAGGVQAGGRRLAPVAAGHWLQVEVTSPLGGRPAPWQVRVTDHQGQVHDSGPLPARSAGWQRLEWLGFIADGTASGVACLAAVQAENTP